jgi:hypothetical protein
LGKIDAPFFGAPKKRKREKRLKNTPFFAVPNAGFERCCGGLGWWVVNAAAGLGFGGYGGVGVVALGFVEWRRCTASALTCS